MGNTFFKQRFLVLLAIVTSMGSVLLWRLLDIQVVRGETFLRQAEENRLHSFMLHPDRGVFLDRYRQPLVWNQRSYYQVQNTTQLYFQKSLLNSNDALHLLATNSASVVSDTVRTYRYPQSLSHMLGYVGAVTADDLKQNPQLLRDEVIGRSGLEFTQEAAVRGLPGKEQYEINAQGKRQRLMDVRPAVSGQNVETSFDPYLAEVAYQALGNVKGAVVMADAQTGEVMALVSKPSYDANMLTTILPDENAERERRRQIAQLFEDPNKPFFNRAISGAYPPGSVFKIVTAIAGLEKGVADANTEVVDEGVLRVGEYEYGNWYFSQYGRTEGPINLRRALARSNDIYFYKLAEWTTPDGIAQYARLLGLGTPTGIQVNGETKGLVPDPAWKQQVLGEPWYLGNTYHYGIGQGDVLVSPVQIAQMMQAVANDGKLCHLTVLSGHPERCTDLGLKKENLQLVKSGLLDACSSGGTAYPFFPYNSTRRVAGDTPEADFQRGAVGCKTGTAEFGGADSRGYRKTHGWFAMNVGIDKAALGLGSVNAETQTPEASNSAQISEKNNSSNQPDLSALRSEWLQQLKKGSFPNQVVITVLVESDEGTPFREGSRDASPVAKAIVDWMYGQKTNSTPVPSATDSAIISE